MSDQSYVRMDIAELCVASCLPELVIVQIIEHGIVEPEGETAAEWVFDMAMLISIKQAYRLHRELAVDWPGIAVAMDLLEQLESVKRENELLRRQLQRFVERRR